MIRWCHFCSPIQPVVDELQCQFNAYQQSQEQVKHILLHWDRVHGLLQVPLPVEEASTVYEGVTTEKKVNCLTVNCIFSIVIRCYAKSTLRSDDNEAFPIMPLVVQLRKGNCWAGAIYCGGKL